MVFLIQNTQNRDNAALHAKLDEIIVHTQGAHNELAAAEDFTDEQLRALKEHFVEVSEKGGTDTKKGMDVAALDRTAPPKNGAATGGSKNRKT
jgi:low affinity Fe/Cu permease